MARVPQVAVESGRRGVAGRTPVRRWSGTTRCNELAVIVMRDGEPVGRESLIAAVRLLHTSCLVSALNFQRLSDSTSIRASSATRTSWSATVGSGSFAAAVAGSFGLSTSGRSCSDSSPSRYRVGRVGESSTRRLCASSILCSRMAASRTSVVSGRAVSSRVSSELFTVQIIFTRPERESRTRPNHRMQRPRVNV